jgi:hypothetical protein
MNLTTMTQITIDGMGWRRTRAYLVRQDQPLPGSRLARRRTRLDAVRCTHSASCGARVKHIAGRTY